MSKNNYEKTENKIVASEKHSGIFYTSAVLCLVASWLLFSNISSMFDDSVRELDAYKCVSYFVTCLGLIISMLVAIKITGSSLRSAIGELKVKPAIYGVSLVVFIGMFTGLSEVNNYFIRLFYNFGYNPAEEVLPELSFFSFISCLFGLAVLPAILEELIFRGFILNGLKGFGEWVAVLLSAAMFAFYHMSPEKTVYQFLVGILFGLIAIKARSILPTVLIHFLNNFLIIINEYFIGFGLTGVYKGIYIACGLIVLFVGTCLVLRKLAMKKSKEASWLDFLTGALGGIFGVLVMWIGGLFGL